jgi:hypothetical protein
MYATRISTGNRNVKQKTWKKHTEQKEGGGGEFSFSAE